MPILLLLFIVFSVGATAFDLMLRARQAAYVARHRGVVPPGFAETVSLADHQRAADYERARLRLGTAASLFGLVVALGWACFGYDALYAAVASLIPQRPHPQRDVPARRRRGLFCAQPSLRHYAHLRRGAALRLSTAARPPPSRWTG